MYEKFKAFKTNRQLSLERDDQGEWLTINFTKGSEGTVAILLYEFSCDLKMKLDSVIMSYQIILVILKR